MTEKTPSPFAAALAAEIARLQLTHREFATRLGVDQSSISRMVADERKPGLEMLLALSRHTRIDLYTWVILAYPDDVGKSGRAVGVGAEARLLQSYFDQLTPRDKTVIMTLIRAMLDE